MALIKCSECGNEISDTADRCPHCGAKPHRKMGCGCWAIIIIVGFFLLAYLSSPPSRRPQIQTDLPYNSAPPVSVPTGNNLFEPLLGNIWIGTKLYLKTSYKYIGNVIDIESDHLFSDGSKRDGVKIAFSEGTTFWMPRETVINLYMTSNKKE